MDQTAHDKLRALRQRLAELEPYPWAPIEAWIASAKPLVKAHYREHFDDFVTSTTTPRWHHTIRFSSGGGRWGEPRRDNFAEAAAAEKRVNSDRAKNAKGIILAFVDGLLNLPTIPAALSTKPSIVSQGEVHHYHGPVHASTTFTSTLNGSTVGSLAVGDQATATGTVTIHHGSLSQTQHEGYLKAAKKALIDDEDQLEAQVYEALGRFLTLARKLQVEGQALPEVQAAMLEALDQAWQGQPLQPLLQGLHVVGALGQHPAAGDVVKKLLGA